MIAREYGVFSAGTPVSVAVGHRTPMGAASIVSLLGLVGSITGCVPYHYERYYRPSAPGGALTRSSVCGGPRDSLQFSFGDVRVSTGLGRPPQGLTVGLDFTVPEGNTVQLLADEALLYVDGLAEPFRARFHDLVYIAAKPPSPPHPIRAPIIGRAKPPGPRYHDRDYFTFAVSTAPERDRVTVRLPPLLVNERRFELPDVVFKWAVDHQFFVPIAC